MGAEKNVEKLHEHKTIKRIAAGTASYSLTKQEVSVIVAATDDTGDISIYPPPPDQSLGRKIYIVVTTIDTSDVLILDRHHITEKIVTLDTSADWVIIYCNGLEWIPIAGTYA